MEVECRYISAYDFLWASAFSQVACAVAEFTAKKWLVDDGFSNTDDDDANTE